MSDAAPTLAVVVHHDHPGEQVAALLACARRLDIDADVVSTRELAVHVDASGSVVFRGDLPFLPRAVITQSVNRSWPFLSTVLATAERAGVSVCNPVGASTVALDKLQTTQRLVAAGVATLPTRALPWGARPSALAPMTGPFVTKPVWGSNGRGVYAHDEWSSASHSLAQERTLGPDGMIGAELVQSRASEAGCDVRVVVMNGQVRAMVQRVPGEGFVANWGSVTATPLDNPDAAREASAAVAALGLWYGGVDLVEHEGQWVVLDVNCWPRDLRVMGEYGGCDLVEELVQLATTAQ
jgi:glutathione synthase/RimK-type ligase-like ATP-grasp enzyme